MRHPPKAAGLSPFDTRHPASKVFSIGPAIVTNKVGTFSHLAHCTVSPAQFVRRRRWLRDATALPPRRPDRLWSGFEQTVRPKQNGSVVLAALGICAWLAEKLASIHDHRHRQIC